MMWKKNWKRYGKMLAAAVFLTVAGFCYAFLEIGGEEDLGFSVISGQESDVRKMQLDRETDADLEAEAVTTILSETEAAVCLVHICGEVNAPGVYELPEGSRIFEAVECAGGFTEQAEDTILNLAAPVSDGMQIVVYSKEEAEAQIKAREEADAGLVNLNTASLEELMTLKGIGESRAEDIIRYREEHGGFQEIEDIMNVPGIKEAGFQKIKDSIKV